VKVDLQFLREVFNEREYFAVFANEYGSRVPTAEEQDAILKTAIMRVGDSPTPDDLTDAISTTTRAWCEAKGGTEPAEAP
jgi:hypothetical protein